MCIPQAVSEYGQGVELLEEDISCNVCQKALVPSKGMLYFVLQKRGSNSDKFVAVKERGIICCGKNYFIPLLFPSISIFEKFIDEMNEMAHRIPDDQLRLWPLLHLQKLPKYSPN